VLLLQAKKYLIKHSTKTITIPRAMMGKQEKSGKALSPQQKISTGEGVGAGGGMMQAMYAHMNNKTIKIF
jgi:hypothetical protein